MAEEKDPQVILYEFWDTLPKTKFVEISKDVLRSHPSRSAILQILRQGRTEGNQKPVRHAMSAEEIRTSLTKDFKIKVSKTGLYFHLSTLENLGLLFVVTRLLEGRHKVAYYSRTAQHLFIRDTESRLEAYERQFEALEKLAQTTPLKKTLHDLSSHPEKFQQIKMEREQALGDWLVKHEDIIGDAGLNLNDLFDALKMVDSVNPRYISLLARIQKSLDI
ncbi:MAG: hypothetical protein ACFFEV_03005 [Candidatus Thorarchaeota archaeon]